MIRIQPDNAILSSISIIRQKKQFVNKINFALSCILQSLRVTNPKYDDNMTHILSETLYKDLALVLNNYQDEEITQQVFSILMKLLSFNNSVGVQIQQTNILKGIEKNIGNVIKSAELLVSFFQKISKCDASSNWYTERDQILGKILTKKMSDENMNHILKYIQQQDNVKIGKGEFFIALPQYTNKKIIKANLYQIYKRIDNKADRLSNTEMNHLLTLVDLYIGDCELCYIIYFILSKFYSFKQAVAANPEYKLIIAYVYALGQANMQFQPAFTDQKSFIYTLAILSQGDRFSECYMKVLMPRFQMIKSEAAQLKFLSQLKKIGLKQNIRQLYNPLKQTLSKSKNPKLAKQYQYLLKNLDIKHQIPNSKDTITLQDSTFKSQKQFSDYFISLLLLITLFEANLPNNQMQKIIIQALRFTKNSRSISLEYISFLYQFIIKIQSQFNKNQHFQNLLIQVYIQYLESESKINKITKLEEIIVRSFSPKIATLVKERDSVRIGVIIPSLVANPATFKTAVNKLSSLKVALKNGEFAINTKFHLVFKVLKACEYTAQIEDVVIQFLQYFIEILQKEKDSKKIALLQGIIKWLPKLQKNHIYVKLIAHTTISFLLQRLFYILVTLIKNLQCHALFQIIFELEQWVPLQELLRKNQADKIISVSLENYSTHTADIIELCEIVFGQPESEYYQKSEQILQVIHKNIKKNLHKYSIEDLAAYHGQIFGQITRKSKFQIKNTKPSPKQLEERCDQLKEFVFLHDNPQEDASAANVITETLKDVVQLSSSIKGKGDPIVDTCAKSILVSLIWTYQNSQNDIPVLMIENLNTLLNSSTVSPLFVRKALQAIATLPHSFNLAKLPFEKLYQKYADNVIILQVLNDLIKIISQNSPKALNSFKFQAFINQILYFLVFEHDNELVQAKLKLLETICLVQCKWNQFLLSKVFILEKIIRADLSNPTFYRPKVIESILNMMDQLDLLKSMPFQLCKLFEKYIDQSQISYMILLNLKQIPAEQVTKNLNQRYLAYILINSQDKDLLEMSNKLMAEYKDLDTNKQEQFVKAFAKKNYDKCQQLITQIEKPHQVQFIKNQVNAFLGSQQIAQCPKVKEFIMTNKKAQPVLYQCQAFYKDEALLNDLVQKFQQIDNQLQVFSFGSDGQITSKKPSVDLNIQAMKQMLKKQNFISKYVETILAGNPAEQLPKVKLICLLSKIPELTQFCDIPAVKKLLDVQIYQTLFYDSGLAFPLYHQNQTNVLNLINHLQSHLLREDGSNTQENKYMCKLLKQILNHKPKNKQYYIRLLEIVPAAKKITNTNNIDILTNMCHQILLLLHEHRKGLKFSSTKQETYFNNLQLILVQHYQSSMTFSDLHNVSLKTIDRLYTNCSSSFQYQLFLYILKKYSDNQSKQKDLQDLIERYNSLEEHVSKFTQNGKTIFHQINNPAPQIAPKLSELMGKLQGQFVSDVAIKQQTIQTITHYSKYFDELLNLKSVKDKKKITEIEDHLIQICNNTFYFNKIIKLKIVEKLIILYGIQSNNVISLLLRLSYNKSGDILKSQVVMKFIKDRLKSVLETKPKQSDELSQIMSLFANSQYSTFQIYFKSGLYSTIIEILKAKVMEKEILQFINGFKMDQKLVNQLYQRGLIQVSIQKIGTSPKEQGEEWITLLGRICINKAIQNKLLEIKIHQQVYKKLKDSQKSSMLKACAVFYSNLAFNNENAVKWMIDKKIVKIYPNECDNLTQSAIVQIVKSIYSIGYNNAAGKKHLIECNIKTKLYNYYSFWLSGIKSTYLIPWNVCRTLSTLVLDPQFAEIIASDKILLLLTKQNIQINNDDECFNPIQFLHNLLANINKPKLYQSLKANKLHQIFKQVRNGEPFFSYKHIEMLIITTCLLARCELLDTKDIDVQYFQFIFKVMIKHNMSDQITETALTKFLQCVKNSKDVRVTQSIITSLEKIVRNRKSDVFMPVVIQIIECIRDLDLIKSIMSKGELPSIICNIYQTYPKDKQSQTQYMNSLILMANSYWIADVIVGCIGKFLLQTIDVMKLKVLDALSQYSSSAGFLIQLNAIITLGHLLGNNPPSDMVFLILEIGKKLFRVKEANQSEKQLWLGVISKIKLDAKSSEVANELKSIFNNKITQLSPEVKEQLNKGILCTLYKTDGSASKLLLTITKSLNQINCIHQGSSTVKSKWRVPINDIKQIISYTDEARFQKSHFYKSNFLGKKPESDRCLSIMAQNNQLHILFPSKQAKQKWVSELMIVQQYVSQMLLMLR